MASCPPQALGRGGRLSSLWSELHQPPPRSPAPPKESRPSQALKVSMGSLGPMGATAPEQPLSSWSFFGAGPHWSEYPCATRKFSQGGLVYQHEWCSSYMSLAELVNLQANSIRYFALLCSICLQDSKKLGTHRLVPSV